MSNYPVNLLASVLAANGDFTTPPQTADEAGTGRFSQEEGWGEVNEESISAGGIPPKRTDFNGVLNLLSGLLYWYQQGGIMTYSASLDYEVGNEVIYGSAKFRCVCENGPTYNCVVPPGSVAFWERIDDTVRYGSNQSLTTAQETRARQNIDALGTEETAAAATKLETARSIQTDLTSTSAASFDGTANITPGVSGILPIANGGTGNAVGRATYIGSSQVGSGTQPVYINSSGSPTASTSTVGTATKPIYMSSGVLTESDSTVGSGVKPVYLNNGVVTASGSTVGSGIKPVYLDSGAITVSSSSVGSSTNPVYLASGVIKACGSIGGESTSYSKAANGYIKFSNSGIIIQWGSLTASSNTTSLTFPITFPSAIVSFSLCQKYNGGSSTDNIGYSSLSTSGATIGARSGERSGKLYWMAIGY